uniref:Uncharacterized protein n=1 Tax=Eutreptiella gymnastica TaxID=73025 RepID=A0A7S4GBP9_9EUGL|mmetsp:Transcript_57609/g.94589  ORF Transcript_57609/g.94589 Transcript_57609/m.94589 type:complete len:116 (+) Transcript_57609:106-453(+)
MPCITKIVQKMPRTPCARPAWQGIPVKMHADCKNQLKIVYRSQNKYPPITAGSLSRGSSPALGAGQRAPKDPKDEKFSRAQAEAQVGEQRGRRSRVTQSQGSELASATIPHRLTW